MVAPAAKFNKYRMEGEREEERKGGRQKERKIFSYILFNFVNKKHILL